VAAHVRRLLPVLLAWAVVAAFARSAWGPRDRTTWFLETVGVLVGLPLIVPTWRRFPSADLLSGMRCSLSSEPSSSGTRPTSA
jgi:putative membrane protein